MTFANSDALWLLIIAPLAALAAALLWRRQLEAMAAWAATALWSRLQVGWSPRRLVASIAALALTLLAIAFGLARPRWGSVEQLVERRGVDIVFLLDSSLSMQARDVAPSRLEIAKAMIRRLVATLPGHRTALIQAEGKGVVLSPLTVDTAVIDLLLDTVFPASLPDPGTRLESALSQALELFPPEGEKHRVVVVVSDGEDHGSDWKEALSDLGDVGVVVHSLGVGTAEGSPIELPGGAPRYKQDRQGEVVITRLQPAILEELTSSTGGVFLEVDSPAVDTRPLVSAIESMEKRSLSGEVLDVAAERFQWPLTVAAVSLTAFLLFPVLVSTRFQGGGA